MKCCLEKQKRYQRLLATPDVQELAEVALFHKLQEKISLQAFKRLDLPVFMGTTVEKVYMMLDHHSAWAGVHKIAGGHGAAITLLYAVEHIMAFIDQRRLWDLPPEGHPVVCVLSADGCRVLGENELFSMGFCHTHKVHSTENVWCIAMIKKTTSETRQAFEMWECEIDMCSIMHQLDGMEHEFPLPSGEHIRCTIWVVAVVDWMASIGMCKDIACPVATGVTDFLCPVCNHSGGDKQYAWGEGPYAPRPLHSAAEFTRWNDHVWGCSLQNFFYRPLHGWARVVSCILSLIVEYIAPLFRDLKVWLCGCVCVWFISHIWSTEYNDCLVPQHFSILGFIWPAVQRCLGPLC